MKSKPPLWRVSVVCPFATEDLTAEVLGSFFGCPASSYTDAETRRTEVSVYLEARPDKNTPAAIEAALQLAGEEAGCAGPIQVSVHRLKNEDWAESWKRHFKPLRVGQALLIKPDWDKTRPHPGQRVVILNPGLSFGTGHHPTTQFCLRQVVRAYLLGVDDLLDIGTGSGILAIAAAKLGYRAVEAFDFDADAVQVARANARSNGVADRIALTQADLTALSLNSRKKHHLVCANLMHDLLIAERERITNRLQPNGWLVLAGILATQFPVVEEAYGELGFRLKKTRVEKEWQSGLFQKG